MAEGQLDNVVLDLWGVSGILADLPKGAEPPE
jgi:hypothetical protein